MKIYRPSVIGNLIWVCKCTEDRRTFFPIPLVGDGAGDTGTKSILFGDEDTDFSRSLSLCKHTFHKRWPSVHRGRSNNNNIKKKKKNLWLTGMLEYYTTDSVCPSKTGGPDNSHVLHMSI